MAAVQKGVRIERLAAESVGLLRGLNAMFAVAFEDAEAYAGAPPGEAYCREALARDEVIALAAVAGEVLVGGLVAYELHKLERARSEVYLYDLAVAAAHRRQGIATALIERLCAVAVARGAWAVFVQADHGDGPAIALYEKLGVREEVLHFDLRMP